MDNAVYELKEVAGYFGVSAETVTRWRKLCPALQGEPPYDLQAVDEWRRAKDKRKHNKKAVTDEGYQDLVRKFKKAQGEKTEAEAKLKDIQVALKQGQLMPVEDVKKSQMQMAATIKQELVNVPAMHADRLLNITRLDEMKERLTIIIDSVLLHLSEGKT